jgi:hypothetical protein
VQTPGAPLFRLTPPNAQQRMTLAFAEPDVPVGDVAAMSVAGFPSSLKVHAATAQAVGEFATVMYPEDLSQSRTMPAFARLAPAAGQVGFTLGGDLVLWSKDGTAISYSGTATDATVALVRGGATPTLVAMLEGTTLSVGGTTLLSLSARSNASMTISGTSRSITVGNDLATSAALDLDVSGLTPWAGYAVMVNQAGARSLAADASGHLKLTGLGPNSTSIDLTPQ